MATVAIYRDEFFESVKDLWDEAYPDAPSWNRAEIVIPTKMASDRDLLQVALDDAGEVIGVVLAGYDGHRGWLYSLTVKSSHQRSGVGSLLVDEIERRLKEMGCNKVNVGLLTMNIPFLLFCHDRGYLVAERLVMGKHLE